MNGPNFLIWCGGTSYSQPVNLSRKLRYFVGNGSGFVMELEAKRIKISIGGITVEAELKPTRTAVGIYNALPIESTLNQWGEEFYCNIPGVKDHRETATTNVKIGDVAFWGLGGMLAVFFGRTPMSIGEDPVPADRVNVVGHLVDNPEVLRQVVGATVMKVEKAS